MTQLFLNDVVIRSISVSSMENNVYLITHRNSGEQLLVDAADDLPAIEALLESAADDAARPHLVQVATTHRHWDHVRALPALLEAHEVRHYAGADDAAGITEECGARVDVLLQHADTMTLGDISIDCVQLRGHTPGSMAYIVKDSSGSCVLLSGDSLFPGGIGRTISPDDFEHLMTDVEERLFGCYPDEALVLPGHGESTTLGAERPHLADWWERGW